MNVATKEHELEVLVRIANLAKTYVSTGALLWDDIAKRACLAKPDCESYVKSLTAYVKQFGGGDDSKFVHELSALHRRFVPGHRCGHQMRIYRQRSW